MRDSVSNGGLEVTPPASSPARFTRTSWPGWKIAPINKSPRRASVNARRIRPTDIKKMARFRNVPGLWCSLAAALCAEGPQALGSPCRRCQFPRFLEVGSRGPPRAPFSKRVLLKPAMFFASERLPCLCSLPSCCQNRLSDRRPRSINSCCPLQQAIRGT